MREPVRRFVVALIILAFLAGTLDGSALGFSLGDPCPPSGQTPAAAAHKDSYRGHHSHVIGKQQAPLSQKNTKCLFYCMAGLNLIPAAPAVADVFFHSVPVPFFVLVKTYTGRSVVLDPGIPKRTA